MVLSAAYSLIFYTNTMLGGLNFLFVKFFSDVSRREFYMIGSLALLTLLLGIFPNLILLAVEGNLPIYLDAVLMFVYF